MSGSTSRPRQFPEPAGATHRQGAGKRPDQHRHVRLTMVRIAIDAVFRRRRTVASESGCASSPAGCQQPTRPGSETPADRSAGRGRRRAYPGTMRSGCEWRAGLTSKTVWLHSQHVVVFGTWNWSNACDNSSKRRFHQYHPGCVNQLPVTQVKQILKRKLFDEARTARSKPLPFRTPSLRVPAFRQSSPTTRRRRTSRTGTCRSPPAPPASSAPTVVLWPATTSAANLHGNWRVIAAPAPPAERRWRTQTYPGMSPPWSILSTNSK